MIFNDKSVFIYQAKNMKEKKILERNKLSSKKITKK